MPNRRVLLFQPKAEEDLELIFAYSESIWGIEQAEKYASRLHSSIIQLLKYPELGAKYRSNASEYRKIIVDRHVIYYRYSNCELIIVRILHSKMNQDNWLK